MPCCPYVQQLEEVERLCWASTSRDCQGESGYLAKKRSGEEK